MEINVATAVFQEESYKSTNCTQKVYWIYISWRHVFFCVFVAKLFLQENLLGNFPIWDISPYGCFQPKNGGSSPQKWIRWVYSGKNPMNKWDDFCGGKRTTIFGFSSIWFVNGTRPNAKLRKLPVDRLVEKREKKAHLNRIIKMPLEYKSTRRIKWSTPPFMSDAWKYMETHEKIIFLITSILCKKSSTVGFPRESKDIAISIPVIYQSNGRIRDYKKHAKTQKHIKYPSQ